MEALAWDAYFRLHMLRIEDALKRKLSITEYETIESILIDVFNHKEGH